MSTSMTVLSVHDQVANAVAPKGRQFTPHPLWVKNLIQDIEPYQRQVWECPLVQETSQGRLSLDQMRGWLLQLYPFIETFPQWIALNIAKTKDAYSREILIDNVRVEKWHAKQWVHMAVAFGIREEELAHVKVLPEVDALTHYMWAVNLRDGLAECMGAMTYAIEGTTQGIARAVLQGFPKYDGHEGIRLTKRACAWMQNHARYDESHPLEALEIIKQYADTENVQVQVKEAAIRSMEYFLMAFDACYRHFSPYGFSHRRHEALAA